MSSRSFAHASQRRQAASNCALASSSVAASPLICPLDGLQTIPYSDQNQRMLSGPPRCS